jgi:hypothetical protein
MKELSDYMSEYEAALSSQSEKLDSPAFIMKPEIFIFAKWERENNLLPWIAGYEEAYENLKKTQPDLYTVVKKGQTLFLRRLQ